MKKEKSIILMSLLILIVVSSCSKDEQTIERAYLNEISGTYNGGYTTDKDSKSVSSTAVVTITSNNEVQIHCYGEILDTTIIMDAFENGDSIMICNTGDDFMNQYGHMGNDYYMMDMQMGETEWMHHMNSDHKEGDEHFGGFDMMQHTFGYTFRMMENDSSYMVMFNGLKH